MAVKLYSDPPRTFSAQFDLQGGVDAGLLVFITPLGTTLATVQWGRQGATLKADGETQHYESLDELTRQVTGTELPVLSLFSWLQGNESGSPGWQTDMQGLALGRLSAHRFFPLPAADLKIILER